MKPPRAATPASPQQQQPAVLPLTSPHAAKPAQERGLSLLGEILDWLLAPLFLLWPLSIGVTYLVAQGIANGPYDQLLVNDLHRVSFSFQRDARNQSLQDVLLSNPDISGSTGANRYLQIATQEKIVLPSNPPLPLPVQHSSQEDLPVDPTVPAFDRVLLANGETVRVAYRWIWLETLDGATWVLLQLAESDALRRQLANEIIKGVIVPQFMILPLAVMLVWFGLTRGLAPLETLRHRLRRRRPSDLQAIDSVGVPHELAPLIDSLNELLQRLDRSVQAQRRFVADAAHQIRTPLAGLRTQAELALRTQDAEERRASLEQLITSSERCTRLVNQLLLMARAEHAPTIGRRQRVNWSEIARTATLDRVPDALARRLDLGFEPIAAVLMVEGDPLLLGEALANVIDNAIRYTPAGGQITVRCEQHGGEARIMVSDTGPGIPPEERPRIFDRFYSVLGRHADGSGLGLAIVLEVITQHGGRVELADADRRPSLETEPIATGTQISLILPLSNSSDPNSGPALERDL